MVRKIPVVWIVGSSTVRRLRAHIEEQKQDVNLDLRCTVSWLGRDGRRWEELLPFLQEMSYLSRVEPDVIVIHLGANSMGFQECGRRSLMKRMKRDIHAVIRLFPNSSLMFSDILPRRHWRYQRTVSGYGMERTRRWLNGVMRGFMADLGMNTTMHPGITLEHLVDDGVNLNTKGNEILLQDIRSSLAKVPGLSVQLAARAAERELTDIRRENALFRQKLTDTQFKLDALEKDPYALDSLARPLPFRAERSPYGPSPLGRPSSETRAFLSPPTLMDGPPPRLSPRVTRGPVEPPGGQGEMERSGGPHSDSGSISPTWERDRRGPPPGPLPGPPGPLGPPGYIFPDSGPMYRRPPPLGHVPPPPPGSIPLGPRGVPPVRPPGPPADMADGPYRENSFGPGEQDHRETGPGAPTEGDPKMGGMPPPGPPMGPMDGSFPRRAPYGPPPPDFYPPRGPGGPPMPMWGPPPPGMMFPPRFPPGGPPPPHMAPYGMPMRPPPPDGFPPPSMGPPPPQQQHPSPPHSQSPEEHTPSPQDII